MYRVRTLFRRQVEEDLDAELEFHIAMATEQRVSRGAAREQARLAAERDFGDVDCIRAQCRAIRDDDPLVLAVLAVRRSFARLRRRPGVALRVVPSLSAAIALCTIAVVTLLAVAAPRLPYDDPNRLVRLNSEVPGIDPTVTWGLAKGQFLLIQERTRQLESVGIYVLEEAVLTDSTDERVVVARVSSSMLDVLSASTALGRALTVADQEHAAPAVALLTHDLWRTRYLGDSLVVGRTVEVGSDSVEVIGVLSAGALLPEEIATPELVSVGMWMPLTLDASEPVVNHHVYRGIGRAAHGASLSDIGVELEALTAELPVVHGDAYPVSFMSSSGFMTTASSLLPAVARGGVSPPWALAAITALLLLLACHAARDALQDLVGDDARAQSADTLGRGHDDHGHDVDTLVLAGLSGLTALAFTALLIHSGWTLGRGITEAVANDATRAILVLVVTTVVAGVLMLALLRMRRLGSRHSARRALTPNMAGAAVRMSIALLLIVAAARQHTAYAAMLREDPGFDVSAVLVTRVSVSPAPDSGSPDKALLSLLESLGSSPRLETVGMTTALPVTGFDGCSGVTPVHSASSRCVGVSVVTGGYFDAMSIPLRGSSWREESSGAGKVVVVSESYARRTWPDRDAVGELLWVGSRSDGAYRVVGIARDVRGRDMTHPDREQVYVPLTSRPHSVTGPTLSSVTLVMKTRASLAVTGELLEAEDRRLGAALAIDGPRPMADVLAASVAHLRMAAAGMGLLGAVALLIAVSAAAPLVRREWRRITVSGRLRIQ